MYGLIGRAATVLVSGLRQLNTLTLTLAAVFIVVASDLQGDAQQHVLHRFKHDLCHTFRLGRHFGEIDDAGNGEARTLRADRRYQALGFDQWQAADPIDLLCNDHFARLQILDHAQQLRAIGTRTRSLLTIDTGDVEAGGLGLLDDRGLSREILAISADALVDPSNLEGCCRSTCHQMLLARSAGVGITSDMVASCVAFLGIPKRTIKFTGGPIFFCGLKRTT